MSERRTRLVTDGAGSGATTDLMDVDKHEFYESSGTDSGFLSGSNLTSELLSEEIKSAPDSGVIDEEVEEDHDRDLSVKIVREDETYMRFDSGVDVGLSETLSGLSLKSGQKLNDLSGGCTTNISNSTARTNEEISNQTSETNDQIFPSDCWKLYFQQDEDGDTPLHLGIIHGFVEAIFSLVRLAPYPYLLDVRNDTCQSPLHLAVLTGQSRIVRLLVIAGARQSIRDRRGETALHLACHKGDLACVKALTAPVADTEVQALGLSCIGVVHETIDLEQRNYEGETCVHVLALEGHVEILRHLVWFGADINAREGKSGYTALHFAIANGHKRLLDFLLKECPRLELDTPAYSRLTAYQLAIDPTVRRILAQRGANTAFDSDSEESYSDDDSDIDNEVSYQPHYTQSTGVAINASA